MSHKALKEVLAKVQTHATSLYKLSQSVAELDLVLSFANQCTLSDYVRPTLGNTMQVTKGRHPVLDKVHAVHCVAHDTQTSPGSAHILLGGNQSGKTTYLKQLCLLQLMAQMGSFIPAQAATMKPVDAILCHFCDEEISSMTASSFTAEMTNIAHILHANSTNALVVIDELGRVSTLLQRQQCMVFFATHFAKVAQLLQQHHSDATKVFSMVRKGNESVSHCGMNGDIHPYTLRPGFILASHYGIKAAERAGLPPELIQSAYQLAKQYMKSEQDD
ncbi:MutS protein msh4 [Dimargaris xerosporica]|nr:MutS protein msh4 [Dimargaris xerosporica]